MSNRQLLPCPAGFAGHGPHWTDRQQYRICLRRATGPGGSTPAGMEASAKAAGRTIGTARPFRKREPDSEPPLSDYLGDKGIELRVLKRNGIQRDADGWEHESFNVALVNENGDRITTPWRRGTGLKDADPRDMAEEVFDSLVSEAWSYEESQGDFRQWHHDMGGSDEPDSLARGRRTFRAVERSRDKLVEFLGGEDELERVATEYERL